MDCSRGAGEVCWRGPSRDRSGATTDKAPSSWIKMALRLDISVLSFVVVCGVRLARVL